MTERQRWRRLLPCPDNPRTQRRARGRSATGRPQKMSPPAMRQALHTRGCKRTQTCVAPKSRPRLSGVHFRAGQSSIRPDSTRGSRLSNRAAAADAFVGVSRLTGGISRRSRGAGRRRTTGRGARRRGDAVLDVIRRDDGTSAK
eukprot:scaffold13057_cov111-Isochrysis_galbana.AAC.1